MLMARRQLVEAERRGCERTLSDQLACWICAPLIRWLWAKIAQRANEGMRLQKSRLKGGSSSEWIEATFPPKCSSKFLFSLSPGQLKAFFFLTWRVLYGQEI